MIITLIHNDKTKQFDSSVISKVKRWLLGNRLNLQHCAFYWNEIFKIETLVAFQCRVAFLTTRGRPDLRIILLCVHMLTHNSATNGTFHISKIIVMFLTPGGLRQKWPKNSLPFFGWPRHVFDCFSKSCNGRILIFWNKFEALKANSK